MVTPVGGVGDILVISKLVYKTGLELKSCPESASVYQDLILELDALDRALKNIYTVRPGTYELRTLDAVRALASVCQRSLEEFLGKIEKFKKGLGTSHATKHPFRRLSRGLQWSFAWKDEVENLRKRLIPKVSTILLLLATQTTETLAKAELDRADLAQAATETQIAILQRLENTNLTGYSKIDQVVGQERAISDSLLAQNGLLREIQHQATTNPQMISLSGDISAVQRQVAVIKADTTSIIDFMAKMMVFFMERVSRIQQIAELISGSVQLTTNMTRDVLQTMASLLQEFWEVRGQLARIEHSLPMRIDCPMVQFRDAFKNVTLFPYHVFRQWEGARRLVAAIFVNRRGLRRVEMGHWFVTHVRRGTRLEPQFWDNAIEPGDELFMTMVFDNIEAPEGFCPIPSCKAVTRNEEIIYGGRHCPKCYRLVQISQEPAIPVHAIRQSRPWIDKDSRSSISSTDTSLAKPFIACNYGSTQTLQENPKAPPSAAAGPADLECDDIEEYFSVQVVVKTQPNLEKHELIDSLHQATETRVEEETPSVDADRSFRVIVQSSTHLKLTLSVVGSDTVRHVKSKIARRERAPAENQQLTFTGKPLRDEKTLSEYGIQQDDTIHLIIISKRKRKDDHSCRGIKTCETIDRSYKKSSSSFSSERPSTPLACGDDGVALLRKHKPNDLDTTSHMPSANGGSESNLDTDQPPQTPRGKPSCDLPPEIANWKSKFPITSPLTTDEDIRQGDVASGGSIKDWNLPFPMVTLSRSVSDVESLRKWVYDSTLCHHGRDAPSTGLVRDFYFLVLRLNESMEKLRSTLQGAQSAADRNMIEGFLTSGDRLKYKLIRYMRDCNDVKLRNTQARHQEAPMTALADLDCFITMFKENTVLKATKKLTQSFRLWIYRFEVNCGFIANCNGGASPVFTTESILSLGIPEVVPEAPFPMPDAVLGSGIMESGLLPLGDSTCAC
ncbi:uncharacterized protein Z518_11224 [Rhinocladiella mackenziei CBS 650.93]|uniref:Ubiquitin-like domain-containing protein n=1 Tax=Rhinocladiella mackenziei CBS 650.93 TaxID=1442369 RepID=A0A0D2I8D1_9EURO|nr:uncharacterized protein Z518_11224 [Rhinocladiella mackenziei CBS 650.93]KIW99485.1 hypothetical protein Z518_11224 [Rhinocladiella mackenziei CBS 650.93]